MDLSSEVKGFSPGQTGPVSSGMGSEDNLGPEGPEEGKKIAEWRGS
jgi:hypothetical protein